MKLSEGVEWSVHCLTLLARVPTGRALPARRLAEFHGVPAPYLAKHLQALARGGLVVSVPGPRGGFLLARPTDEISLLDVVDAVEGQEPAFRCTEIRQRGPVTGHAGSYRTPCGIAAAFAGAELAWRAALAATSLASLVEGWRDGVDDRVWAEGDRWLEDVGR